MLADMLLSNGRSAEALAEYRLCLRADPNRFNSLTGAKHAEDMESRNRRQQ